jgi:serine/threonine protein phosphatase PrpC
MTGTDDRPERRWECWGASVTGPAHRRMKSPNQDFVLARSLSWGNVIAVADGLGSRPLSHVGAQAACRAVLQVAKTFHRHPQGGLEAALGFFHAWWMWLISPHQPDDCAATCLFAIRRAGVVTLAQLGDGLAVACFRDGEDPVVLDGDKADGFANVTRCLRPGHRPGDWRTVQVQEDRVNGIFLCTDGIADDLVPGQAIPFAETVLAHHGALPPARRGREARRWMNGWPTPGHSDDKTIAVLQAVENCP